MNKKNFPADNLSESKNLYQNRISWSDFIETEIKESHDNLSIDREEDF